MTFNQKVASKILFDLNQTNSNQMSLDELEKSIHNHLESIDSTFPLELKMLIARTLDSIQELRVTNYAANLNTDNEGLYEAGVRDHSFDEIITNFQKFIEQ